MNKIGSIRTFLAVVEAKSFSEAARRLSLSAAAVSKAIARLESNLGIRLLSRNTRSVSLTFEGELFCARCQHILSELEEAEAEITQAVRVPSGRLRIQVPRGFGRKILLPALTKWLERFPQVCADVDFSDRRTADLSEEGIDVAIRFGMTGDSRAIARKLTDIHFVICASPTYLRRHGTPLTPQDLKRHNCLAYVLPQTGRYLEWNFTDGKRTWSELLSGTVNVNDAQTLVNCAIDGVGIARVASYLVADEIRAKRLKMVLGEYIPPGPPIQVVYFQRSHLSARVRAFVDFMIELVPPEPWWDRALFDFAQKEYPSGRIHRNNQKVPKLRKSWRL